MHGYWRLLVPLSNCPACGRSWLSCRGEGEKYMIESIRQPRRLAALAAALVALALAVAPAPARAASFPDVGAYDWYANYVSWISDAGVMTGYSDTGLFGPNDPVTRGQVATILYRMETDGDAATYPGGMESQASTTFRDVPSGAYYTAAVEWCYAQGYVTGDTAADGTPAGTFRPEDDITREELAAILWRLEGSQQGTADLSGWPDGGSVSGWARAAVSWAAGAGVMTGSREPSGTYFFPQATATRAQMAKMVCVVLGAGVGEPAQPSQPEEPAVQTEATLDTGSNINDKMRDLVGDIKNDFYMGDIDNLLDKSIKSFSRADYCPDEGAVNISVSGEPVYLWFDASTGAMHWYSDADVVYLNEDSGYLFGLCSALTSFDLSGLDFSKVKDLSNMFYYCSSLTSIDLSGFDTSGVTDMSAMFHECNSLVSLDLSGFDTSSVTSMSFMFKNCTSLTSLDLRTFDTSSLMSVGYMFSGCSSLTYLDVSGFDVSNIDFSTDWKIWNMFTGVNPDAIRLWPGAESYDAQTLELLGLA